MSLVIQPFLARQRRPVERELLGDRVEDALGEVVRGLLLEEPGPSFAITAWWMRPFRSA